MKPFLNFTALPKPNCHLQFIGDDSIEKHIKILLIMKELEHRIYFQKDQNYSPKFLDNKKYNGVRNPSTNGIHHSQKQFSQNNLNKTLPKHHWTVILSQRLKLKFKNIKLRLSTSQSDLAKLSPRFKISEISQKLLCHSSPTPHGQHKHVPHIACTPTSV